MALHVAIAAKQRCPASLFKKAYRCAISRAIRVAQVFVSNMVTS
jgi:hypothetical protein